MNDARIFQIRNGLMVTFAVLGILVMWANVIGLAGAVSVLVHLLLVVNLGALVYFVRITGFETLMTTPIPVVLIGIMLVAAIARFVYAMSYGD